MKVLFFDLRRLYLDQKEQIDRAVTGVLDSGWYILGNSCAKFEEEFAVSLGSGRTLGCNSGTDALILTMLAAGVTPDDEVITVSHTAIPTITAIVTLGAKPVFVEIDPETWLIDASKIQAALTPKTRALLAVHLYGSMVDVPAIKKILLESGREDVSIIEDVAQAHGATWITSGISSQLSSGPESVQAGTQARFGAFSFYPTKNIGALGDAGAVFCRSETDLAQLKMLRNYGQKDRYNALVARGINSRLDEVQAAVLSIKLPKLAEWNAKKSAQMTRYRTELKGLPLQFQKVPKACVPAWHLCVVALENQHSRDRLVQYLADHEIGTVIHYPHPTHLQPAFKGKEQVSLPVTESLASRIVSLPMNVGLTESEQSYVIDKLRAFWTQ